MIKTNHFRIITCTILLGTSLFISCKKDRREELFELTHFIDFTIQPGLNTFDTHFFVVGPVPSSFDQRLEDSGLTRDQVKTIEAKDAVLSSTFGDINLEFIHQISIYIFDPFNPDDKIEFFYLDPTPFRNTNEWRLFPGIADVTDWVDQEFFGIEVRLNFRQNSPSLIPMRLEFDLRAMGE